MKILIGNIGVVRKWRRDALALCLAALSFDTSANPPREPDYAKVASGYEACSWQDNGNGTTTVNVTIKFRDITFNLGQGGGQLVPNSAFRTRGVLIYVYDKTGTLKQSVNAAKSVKLNNVGSSGTHFGIGYAMYHGWSAIGPAWQWKTTGPFTANVVAVIDNSRLTDWPGVNIRAANYTSYYDAADIDGGAYVDGTANGGDCKVVNPTVPPPPPAIAISMAAPDWDLGELPEGNGEKIFPSSSDQLCFTYSGTAVSGKQFIINAGSANGVASSRYRLKNLKDATQLVPYSVTLDSGTSNVSLPNASNTSLPLNSSGRTCFVPTFKTTVDPTVKSGNYSDVLTFTVVTKS